MKSSAKTDWSTSIEANEYLWGDENAARSHDLLAKPVLKHLKRINARKVLDLGCGNGAFSERLREHGFEVTGCDASTSGIDVARTHFPEVRFFLHDATEQLPEEHCGIYDAVVSTEVIEHLLLPRKLMHNASRALKPVGSLIITTPYHGYLKNIALALASKFDDHWHPLRDYGHIKFFSRATITDLFHECGFADVRFDTAGRIPAFACSMVVSGTKSQ